MAIRENANGAWEEVVPRACPNGHPLGVGRIRNAMGEHPEHGVRVRVWICGTCGDETFADPDPEHLPRRQWGPTADGDGR